jgi:hypothetical protein
MHFKVLAHSIDNWGLITGYSLNINMPGLSFKLQVITCLHLKTYFDGQFPFWNNYTM